MNPKIQDNLTPTAAGPASLVMFKSIVFLLINIPNAQANLTMND